jgi:hypothetical protein
MWQGRFEIRTRIGSSNRLAKTAKRGVSVYFLNITMTNSCTMTWVEHLVLMRVMGTYY